MEEMAPWGMKKWKWETLPIELRISMCSASICSEVRSAQNATRSARAYNSAVGAVPLSSKTVRNTRLLK